MTPDLQFLLSASNYGGEHFSPNAREAVEIAAQEMRDVLKIRFLVTQERLKKLDPVRLAETAEANSEPI